MKTCFMCSKEPSHCDGSFEYKQQNCLVEILYSIEIVKTSLQSNSFSSFFLQVSCGTYYSVTSHSSLLPLHFGLMLVLILILPLFFVLKMLFAFYIYCNISIFKCMLD